MIRFVALALAILGCDDEPPDPPREPPPPARPERPARAGELRFTAPEGWQSVPPTSPMRKAEFRLPRADGDAEDAELAVFHFGAGMGGGVQANLDRWVSQIAQPDGSDSHSKMRVDHRSVREMPVTVLDVSGTYVAPLMPGSPDRFDKPGFRLIAAVVESPGGDWFVKVTGPARTVAKWEDAFTDYVNSATFE